ncbi:hypothetical protein [Stenotrophomonas phage SOVA965]
MFAPSIATEVRYRPLGADDSAWVLQRFDTSSAIVIQEAIRGVQYEINARSVAANGRSSEWVAVPVVVPDTNKIGAAAIPNVTQQQSLWGFDTNVTFTATGNFDGSAVATISMSAGTLIIGDQSIEYGASSATWEATPGQLVTLYLYYKDPNYEGGTRLLYIADNPVFPASENGQVAITAIPITYPMPGNTITGGGSVTGQGGSGGTRINEAIA